jgi:hypothetical protein
VRAVLPVLKREDCPDALLEEACGALWGLTLDSENELLAGREGGIEAIVAVLRRPDASNNLLEKAPSPPTSQLHPVSVPRSQRPLSLSITALAYDPPHHPRRHRKDVGHFHRRRRRRRPGEGVARAQRRAYLDSDVERAYLNSDVERACLDSDVERACLDSDVERPASRVVNR